MVHKSQWLSWMLPSPWLCRSGALVAVSGAVNFIKDGNQVGMEPAFITMEPSKAFDATADCALTVFGVAGELGMDITKGPASLRMRMIHLLEGLESCTVFSSEDHNLMMGASCRCVIIQCNRLWMRELHLLLHII